MAAPAPATGGHAAHRVVEAHRESGIGGQRGRRAIEARQIGKQADAGRTARRQMQRDVAAVVDPGSRDAGPLVGRDQGLGHRAGHRRHRGDETLGLGHQRRAGRPHPARDVAAQTAGLGCAVHRQAQLRQFGHQAVQHRDEAAPGRRMRGLHGVGIALGADDDVDRAVLEMPAPAGQHAALRPAHRAAPARAIRHALATHSPTTHPAARGWRRPGRQNAWPWARRRRARTRWPAPGPAAAHRPCGRPAPGSRPAAG